jgi:hypothetical protein
LIKAFISYRREDTSAGFAALIHDRLELVGAEVFMDVDNLPLGVDWEEHIRAALHECDVALVLIGSLWLDVNDATRRRRLDDPKDVLRLEIAEVLRRKRVRVIPVLFGRATMPKAEHLPPDIRALAGKQAFYWRLDQSSGAQLERIDEAVRLGPLDSSVPDPSHADREARPPADPPTRQIGGVLSAHVLALCAELLDELSSDSLRPEIERIQRGLRRPDGDGHILADAVHADAALEALDTLSWRARHLAFIRDRVEELRDSGPEMQVMELAKWYERSSAAEVRLPVEKRRELKRLVTVQSPAARLGLGPGATSADLRRVAVDRALAWRRFEASGLASPMAQRVAGEVVRFYEELAVQGG